MKVSVSLIVLALGLVFATIACQPQTAAPGTPPSQTPKPAASKPAWQEDWDQTLAAAKLEGKVVVISAFGGDGASTLSKAFKNRYGLDMEFIIGRAPEIFAKITTERRAGLYLEDVYLAGISSLATVRDGLIDPLPPLLVLPEVLDKKSWLNDELNFQDGGLTLSYIIKPVHPVEINTDFVKKDEIKSYADLLDPKWKSKIVVQDPTAGGAGTMFFMLLWEFMGPDFTRDLARQDLAVTDSARQAMEWLARGKYPVGGCISVEALTEMMNAGAPIKIVFPKEGTLSTASTGAMAYMDKAPNPHAAKVLLNWLLTKEGQTIMSKIFGSPSRRTDISYDWVDPAFNVQPGYKYINSETEEMLQKRLELQKLSRDIWNIKK